VQVLCQSLAEKWEPRFRHKKNGLASLHGFLVDVSGLNR